MTLNDFQNESSDVGFEILFLADWKSSAGVSLLTKEIFSQAKDNYPTLTVNDLIVQSVWALLHRPDNS
jgi:hypothetical protein